MTEPLKPCPFKPPFEIEDVRGGSEFPEPDYLVIKDSAGTIAGSADSEEEGIWILNALNDACHRPQSPPVAQVEVYRMALEEILGSCDGDLCADMNHHEIAREALLTSKPEPVAPVRKWEAKEYVGLTAKYHGQTYAVYFEDLLPEVQDALNGRKA